MGYFRKVRNGSLGPGKGMFKREDTSGWEKQLERGLPLETRKMKAHRVVQERQQKKAA